MLPTFSQWRFYGKAALIVALGILTVVCYQRGFCIEQLETQINLLAKENALLTKKNETLITAAGAVTAAAQAQNSLCGLALKRREKIEDLAQTKPVTKPEEAVDQETSRRTVIFLNSDLFAPLGGRLRQP